MISSPVRLVPSTYLFENLFALGSVNLIAGMSGVGKTRFVFQLIEEIERHSTLLGLPSLRPIAPWYGAFDRRSGSIAQTLNSMQIELACPVVSLMEQSLTQISPFDSLTLPQAKTIEGHNLVFLDGIDCLVPKLTDSRDVGRLLFQTMKLAQRTNSCIVGIMGTAKVKENEGYAHPRERIIGSSFWARLGEDIMLITAEDPKDKFSRMATILPRNDAEMEIALVLEKGRLVREILAQPDGTDLAFLKALPTLFSSRDAEEIAGQLGMARATCFRALRRLCSQRLLSSPAKGQYLKIAIH